MRFVAGFAAMPPGASPAGREMLVKYGVAAAAAPAAGPNKSPVKSTALAAELVPAKLVMEICLFDLGVTRPVFSLPRGRENFAHQRCRDEVAAVRGDDAGEAQ